MSGAGSAYNEPMSKRSPLRKTLSLGALLCAFTAGMASSALALESELKLEYSPLAPTTDVQYLQALAADSWTGQLYLSIPEPLRPKLGILSTENLPHGVSVHLEVNGTEAEQREIQAIALKQLKSMAEAASLSYTYRLTESPAPTPEMPVRWPLNSRVGLGLAGGGLVLLSLLTWLLGRRRFLNLPSYHGVPVVGMLPAGFGMGGRFLELQTPPGHAIGVFFRRMAARLKPVLREVTLYSPRDLNTSAVVTATLAIALLRERGRVLVVDLAGEDSVLPTILEETDDAGELQEMGTLRSTAIADLDLLTGLIPFGNRRPPLPSELLSNYRWILYHSPAGTPLEHGRHLLVLSGKTGWRELWKELFGAWLCKAKVLGVVLVGADVPKRMRASYMARFYFEKLHGQEFGA